MNKPGQTWRTLAGPTIIIAVGLIMLAVSWRKWPDPLVDFGQGLYVPWQLSQGQVLYSDIAYFNGPFSPYFNTLVFKIFGVGLMSLATANMILLAGLTFIIYRLLCFIGSRLSATVACVCFLVVFGLAQFTNTGNYNFICPYLPELTHGVILSFTAIYLLYRYLHRPRAVLLGLAGACVGLILLTKAEVFLAAALATVVGLILILRQERPTTKRLLSLLGLFAVGLAGPMVCFVLYFSARMPVSQAMQSVLANYTALFATDLVGQKFHRTIMGLDRPSYNLLRMLTVTGWYALLLGPVVILDRSLGRLNAYRKYIQPAVFLAGLAAGLLLLHMVNWFDCLRPLPLFMIITGTTLLIGLLRSTGNKAKHNRLTIALALTVFSLLLLSKMILNVHAYQYGFALAAPATMVFVVFLLSWLPSTIAGKSSDGWLFQTAIAAILIVAFIWHFDASRERFSRRTEQISQGPDMFLAAPWPKGQAVNQALQTIAEHIGPEETFVVFPEGVMLNYLTRRPSPSRYIRFMPPELTIFGQEQILADLQKNPPDYVIRVPRGLREYGYSTFADCAPELADWLETSYSPEHIIATSRRPRSNKVYPIYLRQRINR